MIRRLSLFLLLLPLWAHAQQGVAVKIDSLATVVFPTAPEVRDTLGHRTYTVQNEAGVFMLLSRHIDAQPGFRLSADGLPEFYGGLAEGAQQSSGGKVLRQTEFTADGLRGTEISYTVPALSSTATARNVYVNGYLLTYQVMPVADGGLQPEQQAFLNSFHLQPQVLKHARQYTLAADGQPEKSLPERLGYLTGQLAFYALLGAGLIWLVRRLSRSSRPAKGPQ